MSAIANSLSNVNGPAVAGPVPLFNHASFYMNYSHGLVLLNTNTSRVKGTVKNILEKKQEQPVKTAPAAAPFRVLSLLVSAL